MFRRPVMYTWLWWSAHVLTSTMCVCVYIPAGTVGYDSVAGMVGSKQGKGVYAVYHNSQTFTLHILTYKT